MIRPFVHCVRSGHGFARRWKVMVVKERRKRTVVVGSGTGGTWKTFVRMSVRVVLRRMMSLRRVCVTSATASIDGSDRSGSLR